MTDEELCRELQNGGGAALEALVYRYHGPIYVYLYRQLCDEAVAQDLAQETFIRLCTRVKQYRYPEPFKPWIYRIALNLRRDYWKSRDYRERRQARDIDSAPVVDGLNVESIYERQETRREVMAAINSLADIFRQVILLRFYQEMKVSEIADCLHIPLGTAKWRLFQGLKLMREHLQSGGVACASGSRSSHARESSGVCPL